MRVMNLKNVVVKDKMSIVCPNENRDKTPTEKKALEISERERKDG